MDPETLEAKLTLDEAFENVALEPPDPADDRMPGEFDIT